MRRAESRLYSVVALLETIYLSVYPFTQRHYHYCPTNGLVVCRGRNETETREWHIDNDAFGHCWSLGALVTTAFRSESAEMWVMSVGSHRLMIVMRPCAVVNWENMKSTMNNKNLYQTLAINCLFCASVEEDNLLKWSMVSVLSWVTNKILSIWEAVYKL